VGGDGTLKAIECHCDEPFLHNCCVGGIAAQEETSTGGRDGWRDQLAQVARSAPGLGYN
jgi:hypothetical protein